MHLPQGSSILAPEPRDLFRLNVRRRLPVEDLSSDRYAGIGKSQPKAPAPQVHVRIVVAAVLHGPYSADTWACDHSRMPPRIGGGLLFLGCTLFAVRVNILEEACRPILWRFTGNPPGRLLLTHRVCQLAHLDQVRNVPTGPVTDKKRGSAGGRASSQAAWSSGRFPARREGCGARGPRRPPQSSERAQRADFRPWAGR